MQHTNIEWALNPPPSHIKVDNNGRWHDPAGKFTEQGYTWNPITGCLNNCSYCYARRLANTRLKERYLANTNIVGGYVLARGAYKEGAIPPKDDPFYPRFWEDRLITLGRSESNYHRTKPKGIFVCDMSDLFGIGIPKGWTDRVLADCRVHQKHRFYLLTKQAQNLPEFSPFPDHCYVGVSVTDNTSLDSAMIGLADIIAGRRFISFEPLLLPVNFSEEDAELIDWVIIGAMTCGGADLAKLSYQYPELTPMPYGNRYTLQPKIEWVREIVKAADKAGVEVFLKNDLKQLIYDTQAFELCTKVVHGESEFDGLELILRQEMPNQEG